MTVKYNRFCIEGLRYCRNEACAKLKAAPKKTKGAAK